MQVRRPSIALSPVALLFASALFAAVTFATASGALKPIDRWATVLRLHLPLDLVRWLALPFGLAGSIELTTLATAAAVILLWREDRRLGVAVALAFLAGNVAETVMKAAFLHPNPPILRHTAGAVLPGTHLLRLLTLGAHPVLPPAVLFNSYPSGHMLRGVMLSALLTASHRGAQLRGAAAIFVILLALALVLSGAHWPSDVIAGSLLGWACAAAISVFGRGGHGAGMVRPRPDPTWS